MTRLTPDQIAMLAATKLNVDSFAAEIEREVGFELSKRSYDRLSSELQQAATDILSNMVNLEPTRGERQPMTVKDLTDKLAAYPNDSPVVVVDAGSDDPMVMYVSDEPLSEHARSEAGVHPDAIVCNLVVYYDV